MNYRLKATELVLKNYERISETDFHIPTYITGTVAPTEYKKLLIAESKSLAVDMAIITVKEIINDNPNIYDSDRLNFKYWENVKKELQLIKSK
jgi:hypothetical protein